VPPTSTFGGIDFTGISVSNLDTIRVPDGYSVQVLYKFGDPTNQAAGQPAPNVGYATPAQMELQSGAHHDGMHYFGFALRGSNLPSSTRGLLRVNHEYVDDNITSVAVSPPTSTATSLPRASRRSTRHRARSSSSPASTRPAAR
jgi:secreted PhoX family phosphatase